jgi:hypothetical protein
MPPVTDGRSPIFPACTTGCGKNVDSRPEAKTLFNVRTYSYVLRVHVLYMWFFVMRGMCQFQPRDLAAPVTALTEGGGRQR